MVFMNCMVALALTKKILKLQFFNNWQHESEVLQDQAKTIFPWKFIPITHSIIYHYQKAKKSWFATQKSLTALKLLRIFINVVFRFHSDRVLFRFLIDRILSRIHSDRVLFKSLVIGSSSGCAVIEPPLGSSVLFIRHVTIFLSNLATVFLSKSDLCFTLIRLSKTISLTCFYNFN